MSCNYGTTSLERNRNTPMGFSIQSMNPVSYKEQFLKCLIQAQLVKYYQSENRYEDAMKLCYDVAYGQIWPADKNWNICVAQLCENYQVVTDK